MQSQIRFGIGLTIRVYNCRIVFIFNILWRFKNIYKCRWRATTIINHRVYGLSHQMCVHTFHGNVDSIVFTARRNVIIFKTGRVLLRVAFKIRICIFISQQGSKINLQSVFNQSLPETWLALGFAYFFTLSFFRHQKYDSWAKKIFIHMFVRNIPIPTISSVIRWIKWKGKSTG